MPDENPMSLLNDTPNCRCQSCEHTCHERDATPISDIYERVEPGEIMPPGECPKCGALMDLIQPDWHIVTGRVIGDDEDSLVITQAEDADEAARAFERELLAEHEAGLYGVIPTVVYNYVVCCGSHQPDIKRSI